MSESPAQVHRKRALNVRQCPSGDISANLGRRALLATVLSTALSPSVAEGSGAPLDESAIAETDFDWIDSSRARSVPARLYTPRAPRPGPSPLVVFSHGLGSSRCDYSYLGKHWASNGWASLHVQHVGSDTSIWMGNPWRLMDRLLAAVTEQEAIQRVQDVSFALDQLTSMPQLMALDEKRIVAAGHSFGANTTLLAIGAQFDRGRQRLQHRDPRITAAAIISAPRFYGESNPISVLADVSVPTLHITATGDIIDIPGFVSGTADRIEIFQDIPQAHKRLVIYEGGTHGMFSDRRMTGGLLRNARVKAATKDLSLAFFRQTFDDDNAPMDGWDFRWKSILAEPSAAITSVRSNEPSRV